MKIERIILVLIILSLFLSSMMVFADYNPVPEPKGTIEEAVKKANEEIGFQYYDVSKVNREVYEKYGVLVYGKPSGDKDNKGEYRYLGTMPDGTEYTNYNRMHDAWAGGVLDTRNWIAEPWNNPSTWEKGARENEWNGNNPEWNDAIIAGMKYAYGDGITNGAIGDWTKYVQILQPPTADTWGMGRMWHRTAKGQIWYITFPILPLEADIKTPKFKPEPPDIPKPVTVIDKPRSPNVAIKWDRVPLQIGQSSTVTGKIRRDASKFTWVEYSFEGEQVFQKRSKGKFKFQGSKNYPVKFSQNIFFQPRTSAKDWFTESPKPKYTVPSNGKPGTELIARIKAKVRVNNEFPGLPPAPQKPQPEVPKPSYPKPSPPGPAPTPPPSPPSDADEDELGVYASMWSAYESAYSAWQAEMDRYNQLMEPWIAYENYINSPEYQKYLLEMADYSKLVSVRGEYNENKDMGETKVPLIPVEGYNFAEYAAYHHNFNDFVGKHYRRYVKIEDKSTALYWFTIDFKEAQAESKNVIVHKPVNPKKGGLDPGIIVNPPKPPKSKK